MNPIAAPYRKCYVAFMDILGFKQLVERTTHENLHRLYSDIFIANAAMAVSNGAYKVVEEFSAKYAIPDLSKAKVSCMVVSDSVLLHTTDDSMTSFIDICSVVGKLMVSGIYTGLPMRGAISLGTLSVFNQVAEGSEFGIHGLVGLPLVRAYEEESTYEWAGCVIEQQCINHYIEKSNQFRSKVPTLATMEQLLTAGILVEYAAPLKGEKEVDRYAINWPRHNMSDISSETVRKSFSMHGKSVEPESVQRKISNTLRFLKYSQSKQGVKS